MKTNTDTSNLNLVLDAQAILGEGSFWNYRTQTLWWVDIEGKQLHVFDPKNKENRSYDLGSRVGTVVPSEKGGAVVALQNGIHHLNLESGSLQLLCNPIKKIPNIRFNDGKCDPAGRFWVGTMKLDESEKEASLYKIDLEGKVTEVLSAVTISNGIIWARDKKTMYYTDTPTQNVVAYDFDNAKGTLSNERVVVEIPENLGSPDGMTIDAEGMIWVALFGGYAVVRWNPENGKLLQKIDIPAPNVTSCAFGGSKLDTLYITTGREGLDDDQLKEFPNSGGLFSVKPGVNGVPLDFFKGPIS
ncbi:MAG: SMP-30/gluconolactonase/LRE family protein [Bacteroidota bacterium]|nr:SMP-30/gluconolactonase/LRE family protein [Bacteroidota bacterium]